MGAVSPRRISASSRGRRINDSPGWGRQTPPWTLPTVEVDHQVCRGDVQKNRKLISRRTPTRTSVLSR